MAIYKGETQIRNVYRGDSQFGAVYHGNNAVYTSTKIPEKWTYIEVELDTSDEIGVIPLAAYDANGTEYNLKFIVNGATYPNINGVVNTVEGTGRTVQNVLSDRTIVRIEPNSGRAYPGWGRAFGFGIGTAASNLDFYRQKFIRIINDPDYAHLRSDELAGADFRRQQFSNCVNLESVPDEDMPDTVTTIGNYFKYSQFSGCWSLQNAPKESISENVYSIGSHFRREQYTSCTGLTTAAEESAPSVNVSIGNAYRYQQYLNCTGITRPASEVYYVNSSINPTNHRLEQYLGCNAMLIGEHVHDKVFVEALNGDSTAYRRMFYLALTKTASDTIPKYRLPDGTTVPITDIIPATRKEYLTNRTGIEGYADLNENWK